jgi:hypothetical protein
MAHSLATNFDEKGFFLCKFLQCFQPRYCHLVHITNYDILKGVTSLFVIHNETTGHLHLRQEVFSHLRFLSQGDLTSATQVHIWSREVEGTRIRTQWIQGKDISQLYRDQCQNIQFWPQGDNISQFYRDQCQNIYTDNRVRIFLSFMETNVRISTLTTRRVYFSAL